MRRGAGTARPLTYLAGGHLGSVSLATSSTGAPVSEARYAPFGEVRWPDGAGVTDLNFTGQHKDAGLCLISTPPAGSACKSGISDLEGCLNPGIIFCPASDKNRSLRIELLPGKKPSRGGAISRGALS
jgi:hypothetical protein